MSYTVTPYRFNPPGPPFYLTLSQKAAWPKTYANTANLDNYPELHEVLGLEFYIDHRLYENHGTHWNAKYYDMADNRLLFESDFDIPNPSEGGWTYWTWYRIFSWIGHADWEINHAMSIYVDVTITSDILPTSHYDFYFTVESTIPPPPIPICAPGEKKCIGNDLYECNAEGTGWDLLTENSPICVQPDACPKWWEDFPGAVICWITGGLEGLLGWTQGSLLTTLANVKDLITNFFGDIADFFNDKISSIVDIVTDNVGSIFDWLNDQFFSFISWLEDLPGSIADYISNAIAGAVDFLTDQVDALVAWASEIPGSIADYISDAVSSFADWSEDQLGSLWVGLEVAFITAISGFVDAFFIGLDSGIEQAKTSPLHSDEPVRNPVLKGLQKVVREHRKEHDRNIITGEKEHGTI